MTEKQIPTPADLERMAREHGFRPRVAETPEPAPELTAEGEAAELRREMFAAYFTADAAKAGFDGEALAPYFDPASFAGEDGRLDRERVRAFVASMPAAAQGPAW